MSKLNGDPVQFAQLYLFLALIFHARHAKDHDKTLSMYADLDEKIGWLFRSLWWEEDE
jgi:hypothetical protein